MIKSAGPWACLQPFKMFILSKNVKGQHFLSRSGYFNGFNHGDICTKNYRKFLLNKFCALFFWGLQTSRKKIVLNFYTFRSSWIFFLFKKRRSTWFKQGSIYSMNADPVPGALSHIHIVCRKYVHYTVNGFIKLCF